MTNVFGGNYNNKIVLLLKISAIAIIAPKILAKNHEYNISYAVLFYETDIPLVFPVLLLYTIIFTGFSAFDFKTFFNASLSVS